MKKNVLQVVTGFVLKYIWLFCALLIFMELISVSYTAGILMQQSAQGVVQSVCGEVSGRVDGVLRLLTGLSNDERFADTAAPLFDRAIKTIPYKESYGLFMIALTDEKVNVVSSNETDPNAPDFSLAFRDYMQRLYATGKYQITDAFPAGADNVTMNYTIAVPIIKDDVVKGSVFGSIYLKDIEAILARNSTDDSHNFYLLGQENTIMAGGNKGLYGTSLADNSGDSYFLDCSLNTISRNMQEGKPGKCWEWSADGLTYMTYLPVAPTNWVLVYRVQFVSVLFSLLPVLCIKICFYLLICAAIHLLGRRYLDSHLAEVNHLLNRMAAMQRELFQSEQTDYDSLLELTQKGLTDQLTGLSTRAILFEKMVQIIGAANSYGAVLFLDLDDLKRINDNYGHEGGDCALLYFAQILKQYEQKHGGIAARYGGDEFILLLNAVDEKAAKEIAETLCADLRTMLNAKNHTFPIHGSIGVSVYPAQGTNPEELICKADLALYAAKQGGKNRCAFYGEH